jgi:tRNA (adenine37-N6)-methyltransferase
MARRFGGRPSTKLSEDSHMNKHAKNIIAAVALAGIVVGAMLASGEEKPDRTFVMRPIGQVRVVDGRASIVLDQAFQPGLLGLEGFSHIHVIWWFDQNDTPQKRAVLQVHPRGDAGNPLTGVFACRAPVRPNLIALSLCKVTAIKDNVVEVEKIDAFDGTPVVDIKPYTPGQDSVANAKVPAWAGPK